MWLPYVAVPYKHRDILVPWTGFAMIFKGPGHYIFIDIAN